MERSWREWEFELGPAAPEDTAAREAIFAAVEDAVHAVGGREAASASKLARALGLLTRLSGSRHSPATAAQSWSSQAGSGSPSRTAATTSSTAFATSGSASQWIAWPASVAIDVDDIVGERGESILRLASTSSGPGQSSIVPCVRTTSGMSPRSSSPTSSVVASVSMSRPPSAHEKLVPLR